MHELIRGIADDDRAHDPWGAGMMALYAVCEVITAEGGNVPSEAEYSPSAFGPDLSDDHAKNILAGLYPARFPGWWVEGYNPNLTIEDLEYAALILSRYLDWVELSGKRY